MTAVGRSPYPRRGCLYCLFLGNIVNLPIKISLIISHKDPKVVSKVIRYLQGLYERLPNGEIKKMSVQRGKQLDYLGMKFDLREQGKVSITMPYHVDKAIKEFPGKLRNKSLSSPNTDKLFEIRKEAIDLDPEHAATFHRVVALLQY